MDRMSKGQKENLANLIIWIDRCGSNPYISDLPKGIIVDLKRLFYWSVPEEQVNELLSLLRRAFKGKFGKRASKADTMIAAQLDRECWEYHKRQGFYINFALAILGLGCVIFMIMETLSSRGVRW